MKSLFRLQTKSFHIIIHTFFPNLSALTPTFHPRHLHISTGLTPNHQNSDASNHLSLPCCTISVTLWLNTHKMIWLYKILTSLTRSFNDTSHVTHPSHLHTLCLLQTMQILSFQCPCFSPTCQHFEHILESGHKPYTSFLKSDMMYQVHGLSCQNGR